MRYKRFVFGQVVYEDRDAAVWGLDTAGGEAAKVLSLASTP
jgi:hypothetical protein